MSADPHFWSTLASSSAPPAIRSIIADPDEWSRHDLRARLAAETNVDVVAECRTESELLQAVDAHQPDLVVLESRIRPAGGFETLKAARPEPAPFCCILTFPDPQSFSRAVERHAVACLVKPFEQARIHDALERVRTELLKVSTGALAKRLLELMEQRPQPASQRLVVRSQGRVVFLDFDEIDWIGASANHVLLHTGRQTFTMRACIGRLARTLDPAKFVRVHRSTIVNIRSIRELEPCNRGEFILTLGNGKQLSCSRSYRAELRRLIHRSSL